MGLFDSLIRSFAPYDPTGDSEYYTGMADPRLAAFGGAPSASPIPPQTGPVTVPNRTLPDLSNVVNQGTQGELNQIRLETHKPKLDANGKPILDANGNPVPEMGFGGLKPASKIEAILRFVAPAAAAWLAAKAARRRDRTATFAANLIGGEAQAGVQQAMQPRLEQQQARQRAYQDLQARIAALRATRPTYMENKPIPVLNTKTGLQDFATAEMVQANPGLYRPIPQKETNPPSGNWQPIPDTPFVVSGATGEIKAVQPPNVPMGANLTPVYPADAELGSAAPAPGVSDVPMAGGFTFPGKAEPKQTRSEFERAFFLQNGHYPTADELVKYRQRLSKAGRAPAHPSASEVSRGRKAQIDETARLAAQDASVRFANIQDPVERYNLAVRELRQRAASAQDKDVLADLKAIEQRLFDYLVPKPSGKADPFAAIRARLNAR